MDHSKKQHIEIFAPLGEFLNKMQMEQNELFEIVEMTSKDLEQSLNRLKESLKSLETLLERLPPLEKMPQFDEKKPPL